MPDIRTSKGAGGEFSAGLPLAPENCQTVCRRNTYRVFKRAIDLAISAIVIVLLAPVWLLICVVIKLDSRGPVFYTQKAVGLDGREFVLIKFRSMLPGSQRADHRADILRNMEQKTPTSYDKNGQPVFKTALVDSKRITRVGRFLRRTSLDELPQIWSVLVGEMSVVGPRPSLPWEAELYDQHQRERFRVKPGMTGLYQVSARNRVPIAEMVRIDMEYVRHQSLWLDLKILAKTPAAMFSGM